MALSEPVGGRGRREKQSKETVALLKGKFSKVE
jgi:hypothetical protein